MNTLRAWLLGSLLALLASPVLADLELQLQTEGLEPAQQRASQALLDEALQALPPSFCTAASKEVAASIDSPTKLTSATMSVKRSPISSTSTGGSNCSRAAK